MLTHPQIAAATRIGMLTGERDSASAGAEALRQLARALPLDAATLLALDPLTGTHVQVAGIGYTAEDSQALAAEFVETPWYENVVRQALPPSISEDTGTRFRDGWFYAERVRPAGFRDGVTGALRQYGRLVGLVHLSASDANAYDTDARQLLASVLPALAALADPVPRADGPEDLARESAASLVADGTVIDVPGRERVRALQDPLFLELLRAFTETGGRRLRLLWPAEGTWHRVVLHRHRSGPVARAVLVVETPIDLPHGLSPRELDVLTRAATGQTNQAIAQALYLSPRTVHTHMEHLLRKTGAVCRAEATALAVRDGLLRPAPEQVIRFVER
ncbi:MULTISPECIES: LuxR C-terminal-related transcriptional regulator [unclassified Streptomyces]|uniref:helix-turn-helix transcriptional regulator n=1 Tax=unclassified Streptomyces TaxID=2593676 RepID=UPI002365CF4C|nr:MULTISPECIES: LuxR C-terminal-related transcriptional regulator [unclassified Streptomyces]MDF3141318.1 LuxR C-terminal-related transcriptional regulator [Streptomyces sp. T21Q-yed]WDF43293.1 LuxR C-terminal-related transcriptional regulator [Streptomyces sp. T12]